ncbi:MAG TPA: zinc ribbon domain-containing protein [Candidatus Bathyarchaeia archaeon]|nr:zinc ribbon domain-containing protein [Candidatus Bathyarchaeia archaeon]
MSRIINWKIVSIAKNIDQPMKCPHCGKLLKKGKVICVYCKQDSRKSIKGFDTSETKIECPNCKTLNEPDSVVCSSCGINFIAYKAEKPKDFSGIQGARKRRKHE